MFKLAIEVCFENHFGLIHAIFLSLGSTKSGYFFLGHPVDILAPVKTFTMVIRQRKDWFDEEVSHQNRKVRREERKWIKYSEQQQWRIYHHERNKYNYMTSEKKTKILSDKILMC